MKMINRFLALAIILAMFGCATGGGGSAASAGGGSGGLSKGKLKSMGISENKGY